MEEVKKSTKPKAQKASTTKSTSAKPAAKAKAASTAKAKPAPQAKTKPAAKKPATKTAVTAKPKSTAKKPAKKKPITISEVNDLLQAAEIADDRPGTANSSERNQALARAAADYALAKKATEVSILDLHEVTSMTDFFVVATGSSERQVKAIADGVLEQMKEQQDEDPWKTEGWQGQQWIILDYIDIVVHVFSTEAREFYNLERLWADAPREKRTDTSLGAKEFETPKKGKTAAASKTGKNPPKVKVISRVETISDSDGPSGNSDIDA